MKRGVQQLHKVAIRLCDISGDSKPARFVKEFIFNMPQRIHKRTTDRTRKHVPYNRFHRTSCEKQTTNN
jgi:hypothetical protein